MKRTIESPTSVELTPRNLGILLAVTGGVIAISFWLGARMSSGLAESAGIDVATVPVESGRPSLPGPDDAPDAPIVIDEVVEDLATVEGARPGAVSNEASGRALGEEASEVLKGIRGTDAPDDAEATPGAVAAPAASATVVRDEARASRRPPAAERSTQSATPAVAAAPRSGGYTVQVEAGRSKQSADDRAAELTRQGWTAFVQRADLGARGIYYRVRVGRFETREAASAELDRLARSQGRPASAFVVMAND